MCCSEQFNFSAKGQRDNNHKIFEIIDAFDHISVGFKHLESCLGSFKKALPESKSFEDTFLNMKYRAAFNSEVRALNPIEYAMYHGKQGAVCYMIKVLGVTAKKRKEFCSNVNKRLQKVNKIRNNLVAC